MCSLEPFEQRTLEDLPDHPDRGHAYDRADSHTLDVPFDDGTDCCTHLRTFGTGPPLLLVHGLMTSSYSWRYVFEPLGEYFELYAPDLPGTGRSDKRPDASYDPRTLAAWLADFQRAVRIRGCPVIGNSLGGYLGMWLALEDPKALSSLVNLHSPGVPSLRLRALHAALSIPGATRLIAWLARRNPEQWANRQIHYWDESLKSREETETFARPLAGRAGSRSFAGHLRDALDPAHLSAFVERLADRRERRAGFPVPLFLLYAERDPVVPPSVGERLSELIPDARFESLERVSHFAHVERPETFTELVVDFLDGADPSVHAPR